MSLSAVLYAETKAFTAVVACVASGVVDGDAQVGDLGAQPGEGVGFSSARAVFLDDGSQALEVYGLLGCHGLARVGQFFPVLPTRGRAACRSLAGPDTIRSLPCDWQWK